MFRFILITGVVSVFAAGTAAQTLTADQKTTIDEARAKYYNLELLGFDSASCTVNFDLATIPALPSEDPAADKKLLEKSTISVHIGGTDKSPVSVQIAYPRGASEAEKQRVSQLASVLKSLVQGTFLTWGTKGLHGPIPAFNSEIKSVTAGNDGYTILLNYPGDPVRIELDKNYLATEIVSIGGKIDEKPVYESTPDGWIYSGDLAIDDTNASGQVRVQYVFGSELVDGLRLPTTVHLQVNENIDVKFSFSRCAVKKATVIKIDPPPKDAKQ